MTFAWVTSSNPVAVWWLFLVVVSAANVTLWFALRHHLRNASRNLRAGMFRVELMIFLSAARAWMKDDSADLADTMAAVDRALSQAERLMKFLPNLRRRGEEPEAA